MTATLSAPLLPAAAEFEAADGTTTITGLPGHFCMHYQPQLDLHSGAIVRCEALLRWWHPGFGLLSPYASLMGTQWADEIAGLEAWAAAEVCLQGARWDHHGLPVQIALNVSPSFLLRPRFVEGLRHELDCAGLRPSLLAIDIPVGTLATSARSVTHVAGELVGAGIGVVVDGVVGLTITDRIAALDAEAWKIDLYQPGRGQRGFHASVRLAVERAREAGARAVAKAVEDDAQLDAVRALGFDEAFGRVVSEPLAGPTARGAFRLAPDRQSTLFGPTQAGG